MFSSCFFILDLFPTFNIYFLGNIEKCPFTYWLNGRWFLQIVNREFEHEVKWKVVSQIVDIGRVGIYIQYINKNCGVSFWTCWCEISGNRVTLLSIVFLCCTYVSTVMRSSWHFSTAGSPPKIKKKLIQIFHQITSIFYMSWCWRIDLEWNLFLNFHWALKHIYKMFTSFVDPCILI